MAGKGMNIANRATTGSKLGNKSGGSIGDKLTNIADRAFKKGAGVGSGKSPANFGKLDKQGPSMNSVATRAMGNKTPMGPKGLKGK